MGDSGVSWHPMGWYGGCARRTLVVRRLWWHIPGEDVYAAFGKTDRGRLLSIFFVYAKDKRAIIVSARDMTDKEVRKYVK